ncbi:MAG: metal-dependent transcriptional regulator [Thermoguttaceae bacterium]|jgi:DtxR family Mn-dependent transcriptional regulator
MASTTVENYLKAIYQLGAASESGVVATGQLARRLKITPGSVTLMLRRLAQSRLAKYESHQGVRLTKKGQRVAVRVVRSHRLLELYLTNTLGLPWDEVHDEAEQLEHAVSERLVARIDQYLGYPDRDPHGDPIPDADGKMRTREGTPLAECASQTRCTLLRVPDRSADFLRYLRDGGVTVGAEARVLENQASAGIVTVQVGDRRISLSREMASSILVRPL